MLVKDALGSLIWYITVPFWNFGISIVEIKIKIRTYFKSLASNNTRTWRLKKTSG